MIKVNAYLYLLVFLLLLSCSKGKTNSNSKLEELKFKVSKKILNIKLNDREKSMSYDRIILLNDSVISFSNNDFFISFFDIHKGERLETSYFKKEGPNGLKDAFRGPFFKNLDTIIFTGKYSNNLIMTNFRGEILRKEKISSDETRYFNISFNSPAHLLNNDLIIPLYREFVGEKFKNTPLPVAISYNLKTAKLDSIPLSYINATKNNNSPMLQGTISCLDVKRNRLIYLFRQQNKIYTINQQKELNDFEFSSKYIGDYKNHFKSDDFSKASKHFVESSNNFNIFYDKYRDFFYLIISHGIEIKNDLGTKMNFNNKPFSIIVFDSNFKVLHEEKFKGSSYEIRNCFVGEKGLYISENNLESPLMNEDNLIFSLFKTQNKVE